MSDKSLVLDVPEDLLARAQAAHIDLRRVVIQALEKEVRRIQDVQDIQGMFARIDAMSDEMKPTPVEIDHVTSEVRSNLDGQRRRKTKPLT